MAIEQLSAWLRLLEDQRRVDTLPQPACSCMIVVEPGNRDDNARLGGGGVGRGESEFADPILKLLQDFWRMPRKW